MTEQRKPLLIVEDDIALQKQMKWAFDGYESIVASDRASAIVELRRCEPAVVTMDAHGHSLHKEVFAASQAELAKRL